MSHKLGDYLCGYIKDRVGVLKKYLLAALDNEDQCISYLESHEGMIVPSSDLKNCELLRDAGIFREDIKLSRHGRNSFKFFYLTELGRQFAEELKHESLLRRNPQQ